MMGNPCVDESAGIKPPVTASRQPRAADGHACEACYKTCPSNIKSKFELAVSLHAACPPAVDRCLARHSWRSVCREYPLLRQQGRHLALRRRDLCLQGRLGQRQQEILPGGVWRRFSQPRAGAAGSAWQRRHPGLRLQPEHVLHRPARRAVLLDQHGQQALLAQMRPVPSPVPVNASSWRSVMKTTLPFFLCAVVLAGCAKPAPSPVVIPSETQVKQGTAEPVKK
ncbi:hypothetical protein ODI_R1200 [Orrella dioscoreae]|uniref:Uncharacterized protein n=2 Tax=root TaxID=1 RepID=A0A1C3K5E2_9BURK|nr:hypothetical protein ODI_01621 [Orrella dioscoreae]SOE48046.1 hypothetical protein ODI_R1200 [Orrella dioscoreae]